MAKCKGRITHGIGLMVDEEKKKKNGRAGDLGILSIRGFRRLRAKTAGASRTWLLRKDIMGRSQLSTP